MIDTVPILQIFVSFMLLGIAIHIALRLIYKLGGPLGEDAVYGILNTAGWVFIALAIVTCFIFVASGFGILLATVALVVAIMSVAHHRATQRRILLSTLAIATENDFPLAPAVSALAQEHRGVLRIWAQRLAKLLEEGASLPDAMDTMRYAMPASAGLFARVGEEVGAMGPALREAAATRSVTQSLWQSVSGRIFYLLGILLVIFSVGTFMLIKITPAFEEIFDDFELELPALTQFIIAVGKELSGGLGILVALLVLGLFVLGFVCLAFEMGWLPAVPGLDRLLTQIHTAVVLRALALCCQRNFSMARALATMGPAYPRRRIRRCLLAVAERVRQGNDWCEAMKAENLIGTADAAILQSAQRVGNLSWALDLVADRGLRRLAFRMQAIAQLLIPCVVLGLGVMVMLFVVGMFLPLIALILSLG